MRWSKCFIPTLRESPAGVETAAERLLVRAGFARAVSTGVYGYLPLGRRSLTRLERIARLELEAIGGQETGLDPAAATEIARGELRSAKQLPQIWFRIETSLLRIASSPAWTYTRSARTAPWWKTRYIASSGARACPSDGPGAARWPCTIPVPIRPRSVPLAAPRRCWPTPKAAHSRSPRRGRRPGSGTLPDARTEDHRRARAFHRSARIDADEEPGAGGGR